MEERRKALQGRTDPRTIPELPLLDWAKHEGIFLSPEGAAATAAYDHLLGTGFLKPSDRVVLFNTGAALKYTDVIGAALGLNQERQS